MARRRWSSQTRFLFVKHAVFVVLAILSGAFVVAELFFTLDSTQLYIIDIADEYIALIFLTDFCTRFILSRARQQFIHSHWWELFACIPLTTPITQALRLVRVLSIVRAVRLVTFESPLQKRPK